MRPLANLVWLAIVLLYAAYFSIGALLGDERHALAVAGVTTPWLVTYFQAQALLTCAVYTSAALVMRWYRPDDRAAWLASLVVVVAGVTIPTAGEALALVTGIVPPSDFEGPSGSVQLIAALFLVFPTLRCVPRWAAWLLGAWIAWSLAQLLFPGSPIDSSTWPVIARFVIMSALLGLGVLSQIYRYHFVSTPQQRQQTKLMVFGTVITFLLGIGYAGAQFAFPALTASRTGFEWFVIVGSGVRTALMLAMPVTVTISVLQYRMWDADTIIDRTVVYGALTISVIAVYVAVVGGLDTLLHTHDNPLVALIATGLVAALFQPLRNRVQNFVNLLIYGRRRDPYSVLSGIGRRLEAAIAPEKVLPAIVETIAVALRLPYVALHVHDDDMPTAVYPADVAGAAPARLHSVSIHYQGEIVGVLRLAARQPDDDLSAADLRLIGDLARQAGAAVHAVRLTADVRRSRERLVTASEEERRRLRRDLHDGIAPDLAQYIGTLEAALRDVEGAPQRSARQIDDLIGQSQAMLMRIRQIVYALRPPTLDELGLLSAIREQAALYENQGLELRLQTPERLPALPAAIEVAAYRIVQEALVSLQRSDEGGTTILALDLVGSGLYRALSVEIAADAPPGHSYYSAEQITTMREWAEEVGGACVVSAPEPSSMQISIFLPAAELEGV